MRDFERLEELSSTVRSGLEASGVVWAIDQALAGVALDQETKAALESGREMLKAIASPDARGDKPDSPLAQNMLGGDNVPSVRNMIVDAGLTEEDENPRATLECLAGALDAVSRGESPESIHRELERALEIFAAISAIRLGQAGGISRSGRERSPWLPKMTISPSS